MSLEQLLEKIPRGSPDEGLAREVNFEALPSHIAIIMDGNGRWAAQRHLPRVEGHRSGIEAVREAVETSARLGIGALTLYAFSVENWKRPVTEVTALMTLLKRYLRLELDTLNRNNIRFQVIGRNEELSPDVLAELAAGQEATSRNTGLLFNIALNYGGRAADSHERRDARQQFSPVADRVRRNLGDRYPLARLPPPPSSRGRARVPEKRSPIRRHQSHARALTLVPARVISGAVLLVGVIGALWFLAPIYLVGVALIVALLAFREYLDIAARAGVLVSKPAGAAAVALACVAVAIPGMPIEAALSGTTLGLSTLSLANERPGSEASGALPAAAIAAFAPLYIGVPLGLLAATRWTLGREAALLLILTVAVSDTFQYYSGRAFGRRLLAPVVSPKKTVEGAIGGLVGAVLALSVIGIWWLPLMSLPGRMALGLAIAVVGIVGDLFESLLKRSVNMKDASSIIPGHGGVLDRIDALLFAAPVFYVFVRYSF